MVVGCNPEMRQRSARETGCFVRISSSTPSRLISRASLLDANLAYAKSIQQIPRVLRLRFAVTIYRSLRARRVLSLPIGCPARKLSVIDDEKHKADQPA